MKYLSMAVTVIIALMVTPANAAVWYVHPDSAMNCIQHCLDSCSTGDTVLVGPGVYSENIIWPNTQGIDLTSQYGVDMTYIDGGGTATVIEISTGADSTTIISGFTIQDGLTAGIYCNQNSSPTITGNTITGTTCSGHGGGIYCYLNSSPLITGNIITGNNGTWAGGIECNENSTPTITGNTITDNTSYRGGGISCYYNSSPTITDNEIAQNTAAWTGGGIWCTVNSSPTITGNTIDDNAVSGGAEDVGGGICCVLNSSPTITDNTISNNFASAGGGIFCNEDASPSITNNTITGNTCNQGGAGILVYEYCSSTITGNIVTNNTAGVGGGGIVVQRAFSLVTGNIISGNTAGFGGGIHCTVDDSSTITENTIIGNTANLFGGGISCKLGASTIIEHCTIEGNYGDGIYCFEDGNPIVNNNNIVDNIGYGLRNVSSITINAENNWWGHATGPYHSTNTGGLGDTVSDYVDFNPWLDQPGVSEYIASPPLILDLQVKPNPFSKLTNIRFSIEQSAESALGGIELKIYDAAGRLVKHLYDAMPHAPCALQISWDGTDQASRKSPAGAYFCVLKVGEHSAMKKIVLVD